MGVIVGMGDNICFVKITDFSSEGFQLSQRSADQDDVHSLLGELEGRRMLSLIII